MNKAYVLVMFMVTFCLVMTFFATLNFFAYQPQAPSIALNIVIDGFIITGLALLGVVVNTFAKINAFAMLMFIEIFWFPYYKTIGIFHEVFQYTPIEFEVGIIGIFTALMLAVFAYALIEMSSSTVVTG